MDRIPRVARLRRCPWAMMSNRFAVTQETAEPCKSSPAEPVPQYRVRRSYGHTSHCISKSTGVNLSTQSVIQPPK